MEHVPAWLEPAMKWVVVPVLGWLWMIHKQQGRHSTDIAVLQTKADAHTRHQEQIMTKLDGIEAALRKD